MIDKTDFASDEEYFFYWWLVEGENAKCISDIRYQPKTYELSPRQIRDYEKQLKTKTKIVERFIFQPHSYTPDFSFRVSFPVSECFIFSKYFGESEITVDVKGTFNMYGDPKQFSINQKWMYEKFKVYIEKIVPEKLFEKSWCPEVARYSPKLKKPVKKFVGVTDIDGFLKSMEERK